jgi:hypothetical protein
MRSYLHNVQRYFAYNREEWLSTLAVAATGGLVLGFLRHQPGNEFSLGLATQLFFINFVAVFFLTAFQVGAYKLGGIYFGYRVHFEHYALGLLFGLFLSFISFGFIPFWITGTIAYQVIPNLRIGKFRATMAKNWEMAMTAAAGPLATLLLTVVLNWLLFATGVHFFRDMIIICLLLTFIALLPIPLIQTANPYTVYMSRLESMENNLPGFDLFFGTKVWYFFSIGLFIVFAIISLVWQPTPFVLLISILLGFLSMFLYSKVPLHHL